MCKSLITENFAGRSTYQTEETSIKNKIKILPLIFIMIFSACILIEIQFVRSLAFFVMKVGYDFFDSGE
jgi:hypothetical protein